MNIFALNDSPFQSAREMCDKHVVKMPVETAQMLSTVHRMLDGDPYIDYSKNGRRIQRWRHHTDASSGNVLYRATMMNHPCTIWARETLGNYRWLSAHGIALCDEYTRRYGRTHGSREVLEYCRDTEPENLPVDHRQTPFPQAMPDYCKVMGNSISAYKKYYVAEKRRFATWKQPAKMPKWFDQACLTEDCLKRVDEIIEKTTQDS